MGKNDRKRPAQPPRSVGGGMIRSVSLGVGSTSAVPVGHGKPRGVDVKVGFLKPKPKKRR